MHRAVCAFYARTCETKIFLTAIKTCLIFRVSFSRVNFLQLQVHKLAHEQLNAEDMSAIDETKTRDFDAEIVNDATEWVDTEKKVAANDFNWPSQSDDDNGDADGGDDGARDGDGVMENSTSATTAANTAANITAIVTSLAAVPNPLLAQFLQPKPQRPVKFWWNLRGKGNRPVA
jgi:hypothetical protein